MIHYHGTPMTPESDAAKILRGRHAIVSFANPDQLGIVSEVCQSFVVDNGAFSLWRASREVDWNTYYEWLSPISCHPGFDWAIIPDIIDGDEEANDALLDEWPFPDFGVPVWHLHESIDRLRRLRVSWNRVALGSSGKFAVIGTGKWWTRMAEAMDVLCPDGLPVVKIHGLRMLDVNVFQHFPFASADSTNVARNIGLDSRWTGAYQPPTKAARGIVLADRIEAHQSAPRWQGMPIQGDLLREVTA